MLRTISSMDTAGLLMKNPALFHLSRQFGNGFVTQVAYTPRYAGL